MSIRKVKLESGESKWEVRVHENGRGSRRVTRRFDRKNDAEGFLQEFKRELKSRNEDQFQGVPIRERTFRDEAEHWLRDGKLRFTESHQKRVRGVLKELYPLYGDHSINRITPEFLARYHQLEKEKGLTNSTINRKTEVIQAILNFSLRQRRIPYNPSAGFRKLKSNSTEMTFWNEEEAISFLSQMDELYPKHSESRWVYVVYLLALNTAVRAGEIWGLKVMDIVEQEETIWVRRQFNRVTNSFGPTKSKKSRYVPCSHGLLSEIKSLIQRGNLKPDDTIFRNKFGLPVCHDNFADRQFSKDLKTWGGRRARFHDLRHTATTLMIAAGVDIKTVKEVCGHADIQTTMTYVHLVSGSVGRVTKLFSLKPKTKSEQEEVSEAREL